jgi:hypothetical protein
VRIKNVLITAGVMESVRRMENVFVKRISMGLIAVKVKKYILKLF